MFMVTEHVTITAPDEGPQATGALQRMNRDCGAGVRFTTVPAVKFAAALGEKETAFRWLERAYRERASMMPMASIDPLFNPLRTDSRFEQLLRRVGLPQ